MYYETHITMDHVPDVLSLQVYLNSYGWYYSRIDGDPHLGPLVFHYATRHYAGSWMPDDVKKNLQDMVELLKTRNCSVIRSKIEMVIYDTKTK